MQTFSGVVGREKELALLSGLLEAVLAGEGALVCVRGEPGIGKTTLCRALARVATAQGLQVAWGRAWEWGTAPVFWPWKQVLSSVLDENHTRENEPSLAELLGIDAAATSADSQTRLVLFHAVAGALCRVSQTRPLLLLFEDVHATDTVSLLLLRYFSDWVKDARVLAVVTCRSTDANVASESDRVLSDIQARGRTIQLVGLDPEGVDELVTMRTGERLSPDAVASLHRNTAGNPLFIEELIRNIPKGESWTGALGIPESIRQIFAGRFARLPADVRALLTTAAVVGPESPLPLLRQVMRAPPEDVIATIERAQHEGWLVEVANAPGRYTFPHALMREALYGLVDPRERVRIHLTIGQMLEQTDSRDADPAELARHFLAADEGERGIKYAVAAGDRAMTSLAFEEAVSHYRRALDHLNAGRSGGSRVLERLQIAFGEALLAAGRTEEARRSFLEIATAARSMQSPMLLARAVVSLAKTSEFARRDGEAIAWLHEAEHATRGCDSSERVNVLGTLAMQLWTDPSSHDRRCQFGREAVDLARKIGDVVAEGFALSALLLASWQPSNVSERQTLAIELGELALRIGSPDLRVEALRWRINSSLERGEIADVRFAIEAYTQLAKDQRRPQLVYNAAVRRAMLVFLSGDVAAFSPIVDEVDALGRAAGDSQARSMVTGYRFVVAREIEDQETAIACARAIEIGSRHVASAHLRAQNTLSLVWVGRIDEARREFELLAASEFQEVAPNLNELGTLVHLAEACAALGDALQASVLYERLLPYEELHATLGAAYSLGSTSWALGRLARTAGDQANAERHFEIAIKRHQKMGARLHLAEVRAELAAHILECGTDRARAEHLLDEADTEAKALGSRRLIRLVADIRNRSQPSDRGVIEKPPSFAPGVGTFQREGDTWAVGLGSRLVRVKHSRGMSYLAELLRSSGELSAIELAASSGSVLSSDAGATLDSRAKMEYRRRLSALREELAAAEAAADSASALPCRAEIEAIEDQIARAHGLYGRDRVSGSTRERARAAVTLAIRRAIQAIGRHDRLLGEHLDRAIRTGASCAYVPDPLTAVRWSVNQNSNPA